MSLFILKVFRCFKFYFQDPSHSIKVVFIAERVHFNNSIVILLVMMAIGAALQFKVIVFKLELLISSLG